MAQVFLVDRNDSIRRAMRLALEAGGHRVTEVTEVGGALSLLRLVTSPSVVLVDYTDLWSDGAAVVRAVAADPILAGRHVYLLTTADRPAPLIVIDPLTPLPLLVLLQPFDPPTLLALVAQAAASIAPGTAIWGAWQHKRQVRPRRCNIERYEGTSKRSAVRQSGQHHRQRPSIRLPNDMQATTSVPGMAATQTVGGQTSHGAKHTNGIDTTDAAAPAGKQLEAIEGSARVGSEAEISDLTEMRYGQGMAAGRTAAAADAPDFTRNDDVLQMAWDVSGAKATGFMLAEQEEYCVGWARGYTRCAGEIESVPVNWEDDGGRVT